MLTATEKRAKATERMRAWRAANPEKLAAQLRRRDPVKLAANARAWRKSLPEAKRKEYFRQGNLKRSFGITTAEYQRMLEAQDGKCAICGQYPIGKRLAVDHCHTTKVNRGLLCTPCNTALNRLEAVPQWSERAAEYLTRSKGVS
jgi:hypothetical protein